MMLRARGFTLIELLIAVTIFVFLIMLAGPMYAEFMANHQIRNAADAMLNGVQRAQATAVQRNAPVCLVLDPTTATGGWQIVENDDALGCHEATPPDPAPSNPVQLYRLLDGAPKVAVTPVPANATIVRFDGFGRIATNDPVSTTLTCIKITHSLTGTRPLNVAIGIGGLNGGTKLCDPAALTGEPQACPAACKN
jgi:prepilin-type N-terminal cleavage/methylation domain-containing protein